MKDHHDDDEPSLLCEIRDFREHAARMDKHMDSILHRLEQKLDNIMQEICRQISRESVSWVERWHAENGPSGHSVAFGVLVLPSRRHECCVALHESDAGMIYPRAYEPQNGLLELKLTYEEKKLAGCKI